MSRKIVENDSHVASPTLHTVPSQNHEHGATRHSIAWNDTHTTHIPAAKKIDSSETFDVALGLAIKLDNNETRLAGFTRGDSLPDTEQWGRFSPQNSQTQIQPLDNLSFDAFPVPPEGTESPTPSTLSDSLRRPDSLQGSLAGSFQSTLHGPGLETRAQHGHFLSNPDPMFRPFANAREEGLWFNSLDEYGNKPSGMQHSYPLIGGVNTNGSPSSSITATNTLSLSENSYLYQQPCYPGLFPLNGYTGSDSMSIFPKPGHSPPATASTSSSSGSSSPFTRGDVFENASHKDSTWSHFDPSPNGFPRTPMHSDQISYNVRHSICPAVQDWNADTCDPRGIVGEHDRDDFHPHGNGYAESMIPLPSHSPALSDLSGSSASGEPGEVGLGSVRERPRRPDIGPDPSPYAVSSKSAAGGEGVRGGIVYKIKRKPGGIGAGDETLGMGLEDVDERTLEFTSRQDTKPTRMLRRQCFNCRTWRDVSAWRRSIMQVGHIVCNKCGLYEKAHKKSRPLNDRGEFVRPGKHVPKASAVRGRGRVRASDNAATLGVGVMRFDSDFSAK